MEREHHTGGAGLRVARGVSMLAVLALILVGAGSASAAVTLGPNPLPARDAILIAGTPQTVLNSAVPGGAVLASPFDGLIVRWRAQRTGGPGAMAADTIALRVLHPTGIPGEFLAVGTSDSHSLPGDPDPVGVREFPANLAVRAGDFVGFDTAAGSMPATSSVGASYLSAGTLLDGQMATFSSNPGWYALINADVEPEVTTITSHPKPKVKVRRRKRARLTFTFTSNQPGLGFACALDGAYFSPCTSPRTYRLSRGGYTFHVQATQNGDRFGDPVSFGFKVRRKR
jgi:hypothetical protein